MCVCVYICMHDVTVNPIVGSLYLYIYICIYIFNVEPLVYIVGSLYVYI